MIRKRLFFRDQRGSAGVEMVLMMPLLMILLFGATELGYYFYIEHQVIRGTREAARYAARKVTLPDGTCPDVTAVQSDTLGLLYAAAPAVKDWTGSSVAIDCDSGFTSGLYEDSTGYDEGSGESAPIVTVTATGTTPTIFSFLGFVDANWTVVAKQHAAVIGL